MVIEMSSVATQYAYRLLWAQVVLQAKADLENEPVGSLLFNQAAAFFVSRGGARWINERRQREGLEPEPAPQAKSKTPLVLPRLEALPGPDTHSRKARRRAVAPSGNPFQSRTARRANAG